MNSTGYRYTIAVVRVLFAALGIAAIVAQLIRSVGNWQATGLNVGFGVTNFFSFFTIDANVGAIVVLLIGAALVFARRNDPRWYTVFRAIVVTYMAVTGIVYNLLLRGVELPQGTTVEWSNEVLHVVACAYIVLDWFIAPGRVPLAWKSLRAIVVFPIIWIIYTMVRAPLTTELNYGGKAFYPYPFLDPGLAHEGWFSVVFYMILITGVILGAGAGVIWVSRRWKGTLSA
ncbi:MAG TPA: Pr6Pr family membrane protein [Galbitalea sp.]